MKTLLDGVNEILKRVNEIAGDAGLLTTLTDSARQHPIDLCVQVINEGLDELYSATSKPMPKEQAEATITLVTGTREYVLATDLVQMRWPLIDKTNTQMIWRYDDYNAMLMLDPEQDNTGLPHYGAISPVNGKLHLDCAPTSIENGKIYTYQYDKDLVLTIAASAMPFTDACFRAMVPAWVQLYKREKRNEFDDKLFKMTIGRAARFVTTVQPRNCYSPRG